MRVFDKNLLESIKSKKRVFSMKPSSRQHSVHSVIQTNHHHHHYHHNNNDYNYHHHHYYYHYYNNNYDHNDDDNSESRFILSYVCF